MNGVAEEWEPRGLKPHPFAASGGMAEAMPFHQDHGFGRHGVAWLKPCPSTKALASGGTGWHG